MNVENFGTNDTVDSQHCRNPAPKTGRELEALQLHPSTLLATNHSQAGFKGNGVGRVSCA